jgi:glycine hydroxymethyltransferase
MHVIAAKAQAFAEALEPSFKTYAQQIIKNTQACNNEFARLGAVVSGTETHLFLVDTKKTFGLTGAECSKRLDEVLITLNKNMLPNDQEKPQVTSGVRIGLAAITTRGATEQDAILIAQLIFNYLKGQASQSQTILGVKKLTQRLKNIKDI